MTLVLSPMKVWPKDGYIYFEGHYKGQRMADRTPLTAYGSQCLVQRIVNTVRCIDAFGYVHNGHWSPEQWKTFNDTDVQELPALTEKIHSLCPTY